MDTLSPGDLTAALVELGPERVTRGLRARGHSWDDCFLTLATYGESRVLARELRRRWYTDAMPFLSALVGLSPRGINLVVRAWDRSEAAFRTLAIQWLEQRHTLALAGDRHNGAAGMTASR